MRKNNKRMLVAMLAMAMVLSMTACAEEPAEDTSSSEPESSVSEQVSEPETSDLEVENDTSSDTEAESETSEPAADASSSAVDTGSSTASQPAADTTTSQPAADQGSSQAQQPAASGQGQTSSQSQTQGQSTSTPPATQASNTSSGKGPLAKYVVNVQDSTTPATSVVGTTLNGKSAYYFYSADDKLLGDIPMNYLSQIIRDNGLTYAEADEQKSWFVENFNIYRGLEVGSGSTTGSEPSNSASGSSGSSFSEIDIEELREEFIRLTNEEREKAGLDPYEVNDVAMEFAQIRAEEISEYFSHERPNGDQTGTYSHYTFAENIVQGRRTPKAAIDSFMESSVHRATILSKNCEEFGVGVYEKDGTLYWVQEFIAWDSQG